MPSKLLSPTGTEKVKTLLSEDEIRAGIHNLAKEISGVYGQSPLTIIGIMTGSIMLLADLIRILEMPMRVGVIQTSSYREGIERGKLTVNSMMVPDIRDREVLLIDDIFDTGHTLAEVTLEIQKLGPKSVRSAVLMTKSGRQEVNLQPDFSVFEIPDEFVVGYGLDYRDEYRNLPYIACLKPGSNDS